MRSRRNVTSRLSTLGLAAVALLLMAATPFSCGNVGWTIEILSSDPQHVSGGDALVRVLVPGNANKDNVVLLLNGADVTDSLSPDGADLVGVVEGFILGTNSLELKASANANAVKASLVAVNHPISGPIFSGPQQQPFVCTTARTGLGQPIIDNQDEFGIPVAEEDENGNYPSDGRGYPAAGANIIGWSANCAGERVVDYVYRSTGGGFHPLESPTGPLPPDVAMTTTLDGETVPYIVRWERGTNNRFIYSVAMLAPTTETDPTEPDDSLWNGRLVFSLQGGVAIGHTQGSASTSASLLDDVLQLGYAVVNSTGLRTNTHYNLQLGGETALMLKEHFIEDHGVPLYTVGVGGSGGAIQQYVYAQNHPGLLDAAIPVYSYSDMITQTIHVGDCELLEYYFDSTDRFNTKWQDVLNRRAIQGLNASRSPINMSAGEESQWNQIYGLYALLGFNAPVPESPPTPAITECRRAWFGLTPLVFNPTFEDISDLDKLAQDTSGVEWTHAGDLVNIYGVDETGFARTPWGNAGVQYGLQALTGGVITPAEFLDLNAQVGSWKNTEDIVPEGFPFVGNNIFDFDPWSSRNMNLSPDGGITPASRRTADPDAVAAAYESGMHFGGDIDIPVIDWRHYLEEELDMHHSHQSFATRRRLEQARGNAENQVIWFTDARPFPAFDQTPEAFEVMDEWMANLRENPELGVAGNRPALAVDRCFAFDGTEIAAGADVWDGILDTNSAGACTQAFQIHKSSRIVAGGPIEGGIFQCGLKSVGQAISDGDYGSWTPSGAEQVRLEQIFPDGVCDWSLGDVGRP